MFRDFFHLLKKGGAKTFQTGVLFINKISTLDLCFASVERFFVVSLC